ncbi:MAG: hypothetical protein ACRD3L_10885 [Terriglobales bacterium]
MKTTTVRLSEDQISKLAASATIRGVPVSTVVRQAIDLLLNCDTYLTQQEIERLVSL